MQANWAEPLLPLVDETQVDEPDATETAGPSQPTPPEVQARVEGLQGGAVQLVGPVTLHRPLLQAKEAVPE